MAEKTCNNCENNNEDLMMMPCVQHEKEVGRLMLLIKRFIAITILLIVLLVGTNVAWIIYENSFEDLVVTQENTDGHNNFIGNDGDINNGETNDQNQTQEEKQGE